jgi:hypothetical protein
MRDFFAAIVTIASMFGLWVYLESRFNRTPIDAESWAIYFKPWTTPAKFWATHFLARLENFLARWGNLLGVIISLLAGVTMALVWRFAR